MLKSETREIGGHSVQVLQFPGRKNFELLVDIAKVVGPTLGATLGATNLDDVMESELDFEKVATTVAQSLDKVEVTSLIDRLLASTTIDAKEAASVFDDVFAGPGLWNLVPVIAFVIETNFGNFTELARNVSQVRA